MLPLVDFTEGMLPRTYTTPGHETDESDDHDHDHDGDGGFVAGYVRILTVYGFCKHYTRIPRFVFKTRVFFFFTILREKA